MSGIAIALLAGVFLGLFQSLHGKAEELPIGTATITLLVIAAFAANIFTLIAVGVQGYTSLTARATLAFALSGAIHFSGGWLFIGLSQRRVGVGITGLLVGATPVFTAMVAWVVLGEVLTLRDIVGVLLVVVGVGVASWR